MIMFKHRNMTMAVIFITLKDRTYDITNEDNPYGKRYDFSPNVIPEDLLHML